MMNISEAIAKRKSVRAYLDKPVPADDLARIVEAGQWAPNAGPFQISVVRNAGLRQRINDRTLDAMVHSGNAFLQQRASLPGYQPIYGAPVLILLSAPDECSLQRGQYSARRRKHAPRSDRTGIRIMPYHYPHLGVEWGEQP